MTETPMTQTTEKTEKTEKTDRVRADIEVGVLPSAAFRLFTERFDAIKPREHNLLDVDIAETVLEPRAGGDVYDRGVDGTVCRWGRVLAFEPPDRLLLSWDIAADWTPESDPARCSEVEITFTAVDGGRTRVAIDHRELHRHGDGWPAYGESVRGGWALWLDRYAGLVRTD